MSGIVALPAASAIPQPLVAQAARASTVSPGKRIMTAGQIELCLTVLYRNMTHCLILRDHLTKALSSSFLKNFPNVPTSQDLEQTQPKKAIKQEAKNAQEAFIKAGKALSERLQPGAKLTTPSDQKQFLEGMANQFRNYLKLLEGVNFVSFQTTATQQCYQVLNNKIEELGNAVAAYRCGRDFIERINVSRGHHSLCQSDAENCEFVLRSAINQLICLDEENPATLLWATFRHGLKNKKISQLNADLSQSEAYSLSERICSAYAKKCLDHLNPPVLEEIEDFLKGHEIVQELLKKHLALLSLGNADIQQFENVGNRLKHIFVVKKRMEGRRAAWIENLKKREAYKKTFSNLRVDGNESPAANRGFIEVVRTALEAGRKVFSLVNSEDGGEIALKELAAQMQSKESSANVNAAAAGSGNAAAVGLGNASAAAMPPPEPRQPSNLHQKRRLDLGTVEAPAPLDTQGKPKKLKTEGVPANADKTPATPEKGKV